MHTHTLITHIHTHTPTDSLKHVCFPSKIHPSAQANGSVLHCLTPELLLWGLVVMWFPCLNFQVPPCPTGPPIFTDLLSATPHHQNPEIHTNQSIFSSLRVFILLAPEDLIQHFPLLSPPQSLAFSDFAICLQVIHVVLVWFCFYFV